MIEVIDDLLDKETHELLYNLVKDQHFDWHWCASTVQMPTHLPNDTFQFVKSIYLDLDAEPDLKEKIIDKDPFNEVGRKFPEFFQIAWKALERSEREFAGMDMFLRIKANLLTSVVNRPHYHPPHIDTDGEGFMSCIYYLHDSDGDTHFFPQNEQGTTVTPKANRGVLFDSNIRHCSSNPITTERRMIINSVFRPKYS
jgi:hypothetical protein